MDRIVRHFLCLLIFSLLVSAGGVAPSQTLSPFIAYDDVTSDAIPLKAPHKEQLEAAYSVANRHAVGTIRQERLSLTAQCRMRIIGYGKAVRTALSYLPGVFTFNHHYPEILSPPPKFVVPV